jgi:hypothetical protein
MTQAVRAKIMMRFYRGLCAAFVPVLFAAPPNDGNEFAKGDVKVRAFSRLTFSPDGILFIGDAIGARIFAVDFGDRTPPHDAGKLAIDDLESRIGGMLGVDSRDVLIHDIAVNPISKNAYLAVSRGRRKFTVDWQLPNDVANANALLRVKPDGAIEEVRLSGVRFSFVDVGNPATSDVQTDWRRIKSRADTISDMAFADGKLYVSGLSNEEFSSTMRIYPFPFKGTGSATSLEIYHGSHGMYETEAPVRAFVPVRVRGKSYLLASYLCTPLVLLPVDELQRNRHLKGTTIAEIGDGNTPLSMVSFEDNGRNYILIVNSARGIVLINAEDLAKPLSPITQPMEDTGGIPFRQIHDRGALLVKNYDAKKLLVLRRDPYSGQLQLAVAGFDHL